MERLGPKFQEELRNESFSRNDPVAQSNIIKKITVPEKECCLATLYVPCN